MGGPSIAVLLQLRWFYCRRGRCQNVANETSRKATTGEASRGLSCRRVHRNLMNASSGILSGRHYKRRVWFSLRTRHGFPLNESSLMEYSMTQRRNTTVLRQTPRWSLLLISSCRPRCVAETIVAGPSILDVISPERAGSSSVTTTFHRSMLYSIRQCSLHVLCRQL